MSIDGWMEKLWYAYNRMLFSLKKEENSAIWHNMDESGWHCVHGNKSITEGQTVHDSTYMSI